MTAGEDGDHRSELDLALEALLVGEQRVKVDPTTGRIISRGDSEKSSLTDTEERPTIP